MGVEVEQVHCNSFKHEIGSFCRAFLTYVGKKIMAQNCIKIHSPVFAQLRSIQTHKQTDKNFTFYNINKTNNPVYTPKFSCQRSKKSSQVGEGLKDLKFLSHVCEDQRGCLS